MFPRFEKLHVREVPKEPVPVSQHDIATDQRQTGAAIEDMTERALAQIRRAPVPVSPRVHEPSEGAVIESLTKAALPNAAASARALQKARYENARQHPDNDLARKLATIR
jgi:hypothetical protein